MKFTCKKCNNVITNELSEIIDENKLIFEYWEELIPKWFYFFDKNNVQDLTRIKSPKYLINNYDLINSKEIRGRTSILWYWCCWASWWTENMQCNNRNNIIWIENSDCWLYKNFEFNNNVNLVK